MKSFRAKDGGDQDGGRAQWRTRLQHRKPVNDTHASTTDPDAGLFKKSKGRKAKLDFLCHLLVENGNGMIVDAMHASGTAER